MAKLVAGPAMAMKNSAFALGGSFVRLATPPRRKSVIELTDILNARATIECANSCSTTETKNSSAAIPAMIQVFCSDHCG